MRAPSAVLDLWEAAGYDCVGWSDHVYPCHSEDAGNVDGYAMIRGPQRAEAIAALERSMARGYRYGE